MNQQPRYFKHYKGLFYKLLYIASHSETLEQMVVYQALYGDFSIWVRPKEMFFENVIIEGVEVPRFQEIEKCDIPEALK